MQVATLFVVIAVMLAIGVPIGISICAGLISVAVFFKITTLSFIGQQLYTGLDSFPLMAVPCFMLAGSLMEKGGISKRLVRVAEVFLGHQVGGYCAVTVVACLFFWSYFRIGTCNCSGYRRNYDSIYGKSRI
mgnify:CR=1 FL=1